MEARLREILPKSQHEKIGAILDLMDEARDVYRVVTYGTAGPVHEIEAHGLEMTVDALGRAVSVTFPAGAEVTEWAAR